MSLGESRKKIYLLFLLALIPLLLWPVLSPKTSLCFFAPFFAVLFYKCTFKTILVLSLVCGVFTDLISGQGALGLYTLCYVGSSLLLYHLKVFFFEDGITTLPILSYLYAVMFSLLEILILAFSKQLPQLTLPKVLDHLFVIPLANIIYAFVWFSLPVYWLRRRPGRSRPGLFRRKSPHAGA